MSEHFLEMILTIVVSVLGSSGLWAYIASRNKYQDAASQMLLGLGHDRIIFLERKFIERGYITYDEYENLYEYLYKPYKDMNGNGTAEKLMEDVKKLPIKENIKEVTE